MAKKHPYMKFFPADWLADTCMLSSAAKGVWIDLISVMHGLNRTGSISGTVSEIARAARCPAVEANAAINEIKDKKIADVTIRDGIVTVTCRRMKKDEIERKRVATAMRKTRALRNKGEDVTPYILHSHSHSHSHNKENNTKESPLDLSRLYDEIKKLYPRSLYAGERLIQGEIINAVKREFDKGKELPQIERIMINAVTEYAKAVSTWDSRQMEFAWRAATFFKDGHYLDDPAVWNRSDDHGRNREKGT